jgi:hypothetical protein
MIPAPDGMFISATLRRYAAGSYVAGRWVDGATTDSTIVASIQPVSPNDEKWLPEGARLIDSIVVFSNSEILALDEKTQTTADRILLGGQWYVVHAVDRYDVGMTHYRGLATRVQS